MKWKIPIAEPLLDDSEKKAVIDVIDSGRISQGERVREFEAQIAKYLGRKYAVAMHSGTCANEAMLMALYEPKDFLAPFQGLHVAVPACTSVAVSNPVLTVHGQPDFIDLDYKLCMDASKIPEYDTAVLATYEYGSYPEQFDKMLKLDICLLLEDAAVALGSEYNGRKLGSFGEAASLSFYVNKLITSGEGGMVVTDDEKIATYCREYVNHGRKQSEFHEEWFYYHYGRNAKMTDLQAAVGLAQFGKIQRFIDARKKVASELFKAVHDDRYECLRPSSDEVPWYYWIVNWSGEVNMKEKSRRLQREFGIETRPTMPVLPKLPMYNDTRESWPMAEASQNGFLVSCAPAMLERGDLPYLCESLQEVLRIV